MAAIVPPPYGSPVPLPDGSELAGVVTACLRARWLAARWAEAAERVALTSLNAGFAARRTEGDQPVFGSLARETREISGEIRDLVAECLPLARRVAGASIHLIRASRVRESLRRGSRRAPGCAVASRAREHAETTLVADARALMPALADLTRVFRELEWNLVRLRAVSLYFRIEDGRERHDEAGFRQTSALLAQECEALDGVGTELAETFRACGARLQTTIAGDHG